MGGAVVKERGGMEEASQPSFLTFATGVRPPASISSPACAPLPSTSLISASSHTLPSLRGLDFYFPSFMLLLPLMFWFFFHCFPCLEPLLPQDPSTKILPLFEDPPLKHSLAFPPSKSEMLFSCSVRTLFLLWFCPPWGFWFVFFLNSEP